jgi:hypothetical protein
MQTSTFSDSLQGSSQNASLRDSTLPIAALQKHCFDWLDRQQRRQEMRNDANRCAAIAWGMMTMFATTGSVVAFVFHRNLIQAFPLSDGSVYDPSISTTIQMIPYLLAVFAGLLFVLGGSTVLTGRFPGQRSTLLGIDWATACDAVSQFLSTQSTYSDSLRGASKLIASQRASVPLQQSGQVSTWLETAADRIDGGCQIFQSEQAASADLESVRLLIHAGMQDSNQAGGRSNQQNPSHRWNEAAEHFMTVSQQRLAVLTYSLPSVATIASGILLWVSISASLGWMWRSVAQMLKNLGAGL